MSRLKPVRLLTLLAMVASALVLFNATALAQEEPEAEITAEPGVLVVKVMEESPAAEAGIRRGSIVLRINETDVNDDAALREAIRSLEPDEEVTITILHGDEEREVTVTLGERNGSTFLGVTPYVDPSMVEEIIIDGTPHQFEGPEGGQYAIPARPLMPWREGRGLEGMDNMTVTLTIIDVLADSPAAVAGLETDVTIVAIDGESLNVPHTLSEQVRSLMPGDTIALTIRAADESEEVIEIELGEHPDNAEQAYLGVRVSPQIRIERLERLERDYSDERRGHRFHEGEPHQRRYFFFDRPRDYHFRFWREFTMPFRDYFFWRHDGHRPMEEDVSIFHDLDSTMFDSAPNVEVIVPGVEINRSREEGQGIYMITPNVEEGGEAPSVPHIEIKMMDDVI